jgi:hypothetical protein
MEPPDAVLLSFHGDCCRSSGEWNVNGTVRAHGAVGRPAMLRLAVLTAVFVAVFAAFVVPAQRASAAPSVPQACWSEFSTYKTGPGQIVHATAVKDCTTDDAPVNLSVTLESLICDFYGCFWVPMKSGFGHVTYACSGNYYEDIRSTRLPSKVVRCYPT